MNPENKRSRREEAPTWRAERGIHAASRSGRRWHPEYSGALGSADAEAASRPRSGGQLGQLRIKRMHAFDTQRRGPRSGFTRTELCAVLAGLALIFGIFLPTLAGTRHRSDRLACVSNLGEIGRGYNLWASDHGDYYPFILPRELGGIRYPYNGLEVNVWFQFSWISNELVNARVLACPADEVRRVAVDFSGTPQGLLHPNNRNNAISYFVGRPWYPDGSQMLSGDRNIIARNHRQSSSIFGPESSVRITPSELPEWDETIHRKSGNFVSRDGSVTQAGDIGLAKQASEFTSGNGVAELLLP